MTLPFVSTVDLGTYLRKDLTTDQMALIAVNAACDAVQRFIGQDLSFVEGDDILIDGSGRDALLLPHTPVLSIDYVALFDNSGADDDVLDEGTSWRLADGGILFRTDFDTWPLGRAAVRVIYTHGYATTLEELGSGAFPGIEAVPDTIRLVALSLASRMYAAGSVGAGGAMQSETIGSYSYTLSSTEALAELTSLEQNALSLFRVRKPVSYVHTELSS